MLVTGLGQCSLDYLALVEGYPEIDTKQEVLVWQEQGGGPVATALVTLSRLGMGCRFFGVMGDDEAGKKIERSLVAEGIDTSGLVARKSSSSQIAFIAIEKDSGKRTIFWKRPSGAELGEKELGDHFLEGSHFLLLDGLMEDVSFFAAKKARAGGIPAMLDAGRVREGMIETASLCEYVVASEEFAKTLGWDGDSGAFQKRAERIGAGIVTVTLGERGSVTYAGGRILEIPAFSVGVVDTTGAGDVFHGGYVFGLLRGWDLEKTLFFASAVAAIQCREMGGRRGIPSLSEACSFLNERGFDYLP